MNNRLSYVVAGLFCLFDAGSLAAQDDTESSFVQFFYPNGQVSSEGTMRGERPDGYWRTYYVTGVIKSEGKRTNYLLDSTWNFYNQSGELVQSIDYSIGEKSGYSFTYIYDNPRNPGNATLLSRELYVNGKKEGFSYYYFPTGELRQVVFYRDGRKQGLAREYSKDSVLVTVLEYNDNYLVNRERVNRTDAQGRKQGTHRDYYEDGKIKKEENYLDGQLHGYFREFDQKGELVMAMRYERGNIVEEIDEDLRELLDMKNTYDEQGRLVFSGAYKEGVPVGIHRFYDTAGVVINSFLFNEQGQKVSEGIIDEEGKRLGQWTDYYISGEVRAKGVYENNLRSGGWTFYYRSGEVEQRGQFDRGRYQGQWTWYYPNGNSWREENYLNGREDGPFVEYDQVGKILTKGNYVSGEMDGEWIYQVGDHEERGKYVMGLRAGEWKYFYKDGTLKYEGN
ncbi:MAG: hypothetical protein EHM46_06280 [Bacteroidetes bacterium]|nr:MAG: hypothetical protein EHM46_06280 [Bacteroidota bacterium]